VQQCQATLERLEGSLDAYEEISDRRAVKVSHRLADALEKIQQAYDIELGRVKPLEELTPPPADDEKAKAPRSGKK
jgi:hypothetical protein